MKKLVKLADGTFQFGHQIGTRDIQSFLKEFDHRKPAVSMADKRVWSVPCGNASHSTNKTMRQALQAAH